MSADDVQVAITAFRIVCLLFAAVTLIRAGISLRQARRKLREINKGNHQCY